LKIPFRGIKFLLLKRKKRKPWELKLAGGPLNLKFLPFTLRLKRRISDLKRRWEKPETKSTFTLRLKEKSLRQD